MRIPAAILFVGWIWLSVDAMSLQDEVRQERARCEAGLELGFDMPRYCGKYENQQARR